MDVSIVVPVYNESENLPPLGAALHAVLAPMGRAYEALLVDDGSTDDSWDKLVELTRRYPGFRAIRLRRNFGQTAAMSAGFDQARGAVIVTLDADLQNDRDSAPAGADAAGGGRRERLAARPAGSLPQPAAAVHAGQRAHQPDHRCAAA